MNMIEKRKAMAGQGGFTLIELLVVIAILAVLGGAAIIGIGAMRENATDRVCEVDAKTLKTAAHAAVIENNGGPAADITNNDGSDPFFDGFIEEPAGSAARVSVTTAGDVTTNAATAC